MKRIFYYDGYEVYLNNCTFYVCSSLGELIISFIYKDNVKNVVIGTAYDYRLREVCYSIIEICKRGMY